MDEADDFLFRKDNLVIFISLKFHVISLQILSLTTVSISVRTDAFELKIEKHFFYSRKFVSHIFGEIAEGLTSDLIVFLIYYEKYLNHVAVISANFRASTRVHLGKFVENTAARLMSVALICGQILRSLRIVAWFYVAEEFTALILR